MQNTLHTVWNKELNLSIGCLNTALAKQIDENQQKVMSILKTVIFCGQQNVPLRGHRDDYTPGAINKGNFDALLRFRAEAGDSFS